MSFIASPQPGIGQPGDVLLNGAKWRIKPKSYKSYPADRWGQKISIGSLKYADFNPYESSANAVSFPAGYGLRRASDIGTDDAAESQASSMYYEGQNVECAYNSPFLAPLQTIETLPAATGPAVWLGEYVPTSGANSGTRYYVAVAGQNVYTRAANGTWSSVIALPAPAVQGAVTVFNGALVIGFGAAHQAIYTTDLSTTQSVTNTTPTALYAFALTTDLAALYIAGGTLASDYYKVMSATSPTTFPVPGASSIVVCGSSDSQIISLAPGGWIAFVFVGKENELGEVDRNATYHTLMPYDTRTTGNSLGMRWWGATQGEDAMGQMMIVFPRDRAPWMYAPNIQNSGTAQDLSPWNSPFRRPATIRGHPTAFQGTAKWLYCALSDANGNTNVIKYRQNDFVPYTYLSLGAHACNAIGITGMFATPWTSNPLLFLGYGNNLISVILPADGDNPLDDTLGNCRFAAQGTLDLPQWDLGFPDEDKIAMSVRLIGDNLSAGQTIDVWASLDGAAYSLLGSATSGPESTILFATNTKVKRIQMRLVFNTNDSTKTPVLQALSMRCYINPFMYRMWEFVGTKGGQMPSGSPDLDNLKTALDGVWTAYSSGYPVNFTDRWGTSYTVRILNFAEQDVGREPEGVPETEVTFQLLEVTSGLGTNVWDATLFTWDATTSLWD